MQNKISFINIFDKISLVGFGLGFLNDLQIIGGLLVIVSAILSIIIKSKQIKIIKKITNDGKF
jgi:hypothetical protein